MNNEQKQRMTHELGQWNAAMKSSCSVSDLLAISTRMAALLQELIDAPDPEQPNQSEQHLDMVKDAERVFIKKIAEQTPEKPDYWSECGQCSYNISEAQDLIDAAIAAEKGGA